MTVQNYNILTLTKASGLSKTAIGFWLKYKIYPSISILIKLSDFFKCSLDYFSARCDDYAPKEFFKNFIFIERLDFLIKRKGHNLLPLIKRFI